MNYLIILFLLALSALFSGLTLGYFSLNLADLRRKAKLGNKKAYEVYTIRKNGSQLLVTLLIGNVAVNSVLSIFLGSLITGVLAAVIATSTIVIFGEILPQAFFSRYALKIGFYFTPLTRFFIFILFPITFPISWSLQKILGSEDLNIYSKHELIKLVEEHEDHPDSTIDETEERIIRGALTFSDKKVHEVMRTRNEIIALPADEILSQSVINTIKDSGHSRFPVYQGSLDNIIGILFAKDIAGEESKYQKINEITRGKINSISKDKYLDDVLAEFKRRKIHLFIVRDGNGKTIGLITIEDILEEILGTDILDEHDDESDEKWGEK